MDLPEQDKPDPNPGAETITAHERPRPDRRLAADRITALHLEVVGGPMDGVAAHVAGDVITIGRSPRNDLSLRLDPMVSTVHARIIREGNSFWLEDLDSRNGTYIGEQRIEGRTVIGAGTLFVLGGTCLEFTPG